MIKIGLYFVIGVLLGGLATETIVEAPTNLGSGAGGSAFFVTGSGPKYVGSLSDGCAEWFSNMLTTTGIDCGSGSGGGGFFDWNFPYLTPNVASTSVFAAIKADSFVATSAATSSVFVNASTTNVTVSGNLWADLTGNADTATALASNGANCSAGNSPLGVDASGAVESCFDVWTEAENTSAGYISDISGFDTGDLTEGSNLYYTTGRVSSYLYASTTLSDLFTAGTGLSWTGNTINAEVEASDLHDAVTITGEDFISLSTQQLTANAINPDNLASADFGDFTCNGTICSLDDGVSQWTDGGFYLYPNEVTDSVLVGTSSIASSLSALVVQATTTERLMRLYENAGGEYMDLLIDASGDLKFNTDSGTTALLLDEAGTDIYVNRLAGMLTNASKDSNTYIDFPTGDRLDIVVGGITFASIIEAATDVLTALGEWDFGGATSLELPNGTNPTVDATGEVAYDTTTGQPVIYNGSSVDTLFTEIPRSLGRIGSTSYDYALNTFSSATTTWSLGTLRENSMYTGIKMYTDTGTCLVRIGDYAATTTAFSASTTANFNAYSSNNAFTTTDKPVLEIGSCASTPNFIDITLFMTETRQ